MTRKRMPPFVVNAITKDIAQRIKQDKRIARVKLGPATTGCCRKIDLWPAGGEGGYEAKSTIAQAMDGVAQSMGLTKGNFGWAGDGFSVVENNDLEAQGNKQTLQVSRKFIHNPACRNTNPPPTRLGEFGRLMEYATPYDQEMSPDDPLLPARLRRKIVKRARAAGYLADQTTSMWAILMESPLEELKQKARQESRNPRGNPWDASGNWQAKEVPPALVEATAKAEWAIKDAEEAGQHAFAMGDMVGVKKYARQIEQAQRDLSKLKAARGEAGARIWTGIYGSDTPAESARKKYFATRYRRGVGHEAGEVIAGQARGGRYRNPTHKEVRKAIWQAFGAAGWTLSSPSLKVLYATTPWMGTKVRLWFKARAVLVEKDGPPWRVGTAHTLAPGLDLRKVTDPAAFVGAVERMVGVK